MSFVKKNQSEEIPETSRVRIVLSSRNCKAIEKVSSDLISRAKETQTPVFGPRRFPTRTLRHTTRKTPCGNGTNTWDTYEMKIYKRVIEIMGTREVVKAVTAIEIAPGVDVDVSLDVRK
eukprot:Tbor_TRINITY_DN6950_c0_g1::TRINITY_DN6950_c0_g1_i1::g.17535::m.17535/K02969/RP-S20e, RPS20; small subunit ribosomal protein S20e